MTYKLTLDIGVSKQPELAASMTILKRWMTEGKIELIEAAGTPKPAAYGWPGAAPVPQQSGRHKHRPKSESTAKFREVSAVVFPHKDAQKLDMREINSVAHLVKHLASKNEFFVTANTKDFIDDGKRERLKGSLGVIALSPAEAVDVLGKMESWK